MVPTTVLAPSRGKRRRPSGVPGPHQLGASRQEALWALGAMLVLTLLALSFWFEATH